MALPAISTLNTKIAPLPPITKTLTLTRHVSTHAYNPPTHAENANVPLEITPTNHAPTQNYFSPAVLHPYDLQGNGHARNTHTHTSKLACSCTCSSAQTKTLTTLVTRPNNGCHGCGYICRDERGHNFPPRNRHTTLTTQTSLSRTASPRAGTSTEDNPATIPRRQKRKPCKNRASQVPKTNPSIDPNTPKCRPKSHSKSESTSAAPDQHPTNTMNIIGVTHKPLPSHTLLAENLHTHTHTSIFPPSTTSSPSTSPPTNHAEYAPTPQLSPAPRFRFRFPNASPPTFFYPVSLAAQAAIHHHHHTNSPNFLAKMDHEFTYLPLGFKVLVYGMIALGLAWAVLVCCVNFPPATILRRRRSRNTGSEKKRKSKRRESQRYRSWYAKILLPAWLGGGETKKRKPIDKASKYAAVPTRSSESEGEGCVSTATATWMRSRTASGIELERRGPQHSSSSSSTPYPGSATMRLDERQSHSHTGVCTTTTPLHDTAIDDCSPSRPPSPINPFLPASAGRPLSSSEWLAARSAFLSRSNSRSQSHSHSPTRSSTSFDDVEAQTPSMSNRASRVLAENPLERYINNGRGNTSGNGSWLDMVDGAVNRAVGMVARWTDDGGGEEGLLLPVAKGGKIE